MLGKVPLLLKLLISYLGIDYVFVAVGGGGLLAGVLAVFKTVSPNTVVVGVEPDNSACLTAALAAKTPVPLDMVGIFADGVAVKQIGDVTFSIIEPHIDDMVSVTTDDICAGIKEFMMKLVVWLNLLVPYRWPA